MTLATLKNSAIIILLLTLSGSTLWAVHRISATSRKVEELTAQLDISLKRTDEYLDFQLDQFQDPRFQAQIENGVKAGKAARLLIDRLDRQMVPALVSSANSLTRTSDTTATLIANLDHRMNDELLPSATKLLDQGTITVADVSEAIKIGQERLIITSDNANKLLTDPALFQTLRNMEASSGDFDKFVKSMGGVAMNFEEASKRWPTLFDLFEKYQRTANKYVKYVYLARIVNLIAGILP